MPFAIQEFRQQAVDDAGGLRLLLLDSRERLAAQALELLVRKSGIEQQVRIQLQ